MEHLHTMRIVVRRTGLSPHLIRIWERRYGAVTPARNGANRRLYNDAEVARLALLHEATCAGHSIGQIAKLSEAELHGLLSRERVTGSGANGFDGFEAPMPYTKSRSHPDYVAEAMAGIRGLDAQSLVGVLQHAAADLGRRRVLQCVVVPLIQQIGDSWQAGHLKVAHEHLASAVIRTYLGGLARAHPLPQAAARLMVTTPRGHLHELGAILVAVTASHQGWHATYLGPCLPAEEIAGAAIQGRARAVALSLVYPEDDPHLESELTRLRQLLPAEVVVLAGGRAAPAYREVLQRIGAIQLDDLPMLQAELEELRKTRRP